MKKDDATLLDMMLVLGMIILSNLVFWGGIAFIVHYYCKHP
jgi:hypothetical protein